MIVLIIKLTMNEEVLSVIFSFVEYHDYKNFYLVNIEWRRAISKYTDYLTFLNYQKRAVSNYDNNIEELIFVACENNDFKMIKWISSNYKINNNVYYAIFRKCCLEEKLEIAEYIYFLQVVDELNAIKMFSELCCRKGYHIIEWYYNLVNLQKLGYNDATYIFKCCCKSLTIYLKFNKLEQIKIYKSSIEDCLNGHKNIIDTYSSHNTKRYVYNIQTNSSYFSYLHKKIYGNLYIFNDLNNYFSWICQNSNIDHIKRIYSSKKVSSVSSGFIFSCKANRVDVVEYLYNLGFFPSDIRVVFHIACKNKSLDVVKWFHQKNLLNYIDNFTDYFILACNYGNLSIAKFIYQCFKKKVDVCHKNHLVFRMSCQKNYLEQAKWLYSLEEMKFFVNFYDILKVCCQKNYIDMVEWIFTLNSTDETFEFIFDKSCDYQSFIILGWLFSLNNKNIQSIVLKNFHYACMSDNVVLAKFLFKFLFIYIDTQIIDICHRYKSWKIIDWINEN